MTFSHFLQFIPGRNPETTKIFRYALPPDVAQPT